MVWIHRKKIIQAAHVILASYRYWGIANSLISKPKKTFSLLALQSIFYTHIYYNIYYMSCFILKFNSLSSPIQWVYNNIITDNIYSEFYHKPYKQLLLDTLFPQHFFSITHISVFTIFSIQPLYYSLWSIVFYLHPPLLDIYLLFLAKSLSWASYILQTATIFHHLLITSYTYLH